MPDDQSQKNSLQIQRLQAYAGLLFIAMAVVSFGAAIYFIVTSGVFQFQIHGPQPVETPDKVFLKIMQDNSEATFLILGATLGSILGASLLNTAIHAARPTISDEDRTLLHPLIQSADENAINQYVRISSLTGSTGFFTKLGFTGLPLVTAALGLLLILLAMLASDETMKTDLMDLAKLVLGAFIGSFVQRRVDRSTDPDKKLPEELM